MPIFLLPLAAALALQAKPPAPPKLPPEIGALVDRARGLPPEFAADILLRLADSDKVIPAWKRQLIEEAFRQAAGVQQRMKRRAVEPGKADTRPYFLARAFAQDFDQLSLQCRAVEAMLALDKRVARELFEQVPRPQVPAVQCEDPLVYDVSAYYQALAKVVSESFSAKERADGDPIKLAVSVTASFSSPVQVGPIAKALAAMRISSEQLEALVAAFSTALRDLGGDDRSFSFSVSRYSTMLSDVAQLAAACRRQEIGTYPLIEAVRAYLARHLGGARCLDTTGFSISAGMVGPAQSAAPTADPVAFFNRKLLPEAWPGGAPIRPLEGDEIRASKLEGTPPSASASEWNNAGLNQLVAKYRQLMFASDGSPRPSEQKDTSEWKTQLREYLSALADWQPGDAASSADYFHQKCYLLSSLVNAVPNGEARDRVLRALLTFLEQSSFRQESRMEWFLPVNSLLVRVTTDSALAEMAQAMRNSGDPVISLYAQLEVLLPRPPSKTLGLF